MNDELTTRLREQLHDQVDGLHSAPLTLESVRGRAHAIRRTRRLAVAGAAVVAVAAIIFPAALLGDSAGRSDRSPQPAETPTEVVDPHQVDRPVLGVPYITDRQLVLPDGTVRELPGDYLGGAVLGDTVLGLRDDGSGFRVLDELDAEGQVVESVVTESGITRNVDGSAVAYVTEGSLVVRGEEGQTTLGDVEQVQPARLYGGPDCDESAGDCLVFANDETGSPLVVTASGETTGILGDPLSVTDVASDGRTSMVTRITDLPEPGSCSAVYDQRRDREVHSSCEYTYGHFSPDGALLAATHPDQDGFGDGWHAILDAATGEELSRYESPRGGITSSVWEDDQHLLVTSYADGRWKVTRLGADGSTDVVLGPTRGREDRPTYAVLGETF